jgi:hypothetical protein
MRFIPTRFHGVLDYVTGLVLIIAPWLINFSNVATAAWVMVIAGMSVLLQTAFTDFEVGLIRKISMKVHLTIDFGLGILLALSPWLLNFNKQLFLPHLIGGLFIAIASLTTHRVPSKIYTSLHAHQDLLR